jgi:hypothetical protein
LSVTDSPLAEKQKRRHRKLVAREGRPLKNSKEDLKAKSDLKKARTSSSPSKKSQASGSSSKPTTVKSEGKKKQEKPQSQVFLPSRL